MAEEPLEKMPIQGDPAPARRGGAGWFGWTLVTLPLFYFLSAGPVLTLVNRNVIPRPVAGTLYTPLFWFAGKFPPLNTCLNWYLGNVWGWRPLIY